MFKPVEKYGQVEVQIDDASGKAQLRRSTTLTCGVDLDDWKSIIRAALNVGCTADELVWLLDKRMPG